MVFCLLASEAAAQECELLPWEEGGRHFLTIDDDVFFYMPLEQSRQLQSELTRCQGIEQELDLRVQQVERYQTLIEIHEGIQQELRVELQFQKDLYNQRDNQGTKWEAFIANPKVNLVAGILIGGITVGLTYHYLIMEN